MTTTSMLICSRASTLRERTDHQCGETVLLALAHAAGSGLSTSLVYHHHPSIPPRFPPFLCTHFIDLVHLRFFLTFIRSFRDCLSDFTSNCTAHLTAVHSTRPQTSARPF